MPINPIHWLKTSFLWIQFPLIGFQPDCEQKTLMQVNHSVTYIVFDDSGPTGPLKDPISAPNGTEKWVSGIADSIFVFLSGKDERRPDSIYVAVKIVTRCLSHLHPILQN